VLQTCQDERISGVTDGEASAAAGDYDHSGSIVVPVATSHVMDDIEVAQSWGWNETPDSIDPE